MLALLIIYPIVAVAICSVLYYVVKFSVKSAIREINDEKKND